jgi:hypothetical protein
MTNGQQLTWLDILEHCGLRVLETAVPQEAPPVNTAIYEKWHHCASASALHGDKGEFLILPRLSGGSEIGWVAVTDPVGEHLP